MEAADHPMKAEIAATAARLVVEEGLEYGPAKRRAIRHLGLPSRSAMPGNDELEDAVLDYIAIFCADTQPVELTALRRLALRNGGRYARAVTNIPYQEFVLRSLRSGRVVA